MNLGGIDHTGIAVTDLNLALARYQRIFGLEPSERHIVEDQKVEVAFLALGSTQLELVCPLAPDTGVARFLQKHGESLHHVAFAVQDIEAELRTLQREGVHLIDSEPRRGVHGRIAFVHPKSTGGVLIELVEAPMRPQ